MLIHKVKCNRQFTGFYINSVQNGSLSFRQLVNFDRPPFQTGLFKDLEVATVVFFD